MIAHSPRDHKPNLPEPATAEPALEACLSRSRDQIIGANQAIYIAEAIKLLALQLRE